MAECTYCGEYEVVLDEKAGHMVCDCCGVISQESVVAHDTSAIKTIMLNTMCPLQRSRPQTTDVRWISERSRIEVKTQSF
jgi:uncharacterized Zn finger protein